MSNQRYAGPIKQGTNLTPTEAAEIESHILAAARHMEQAERLMQRRVTVCGRRGCTDPNCTGCPFDAESRVANRCALLASVVMVCFLALFTGIAGAQTSPPVPASAVLSWTLPTTAADGSALTGPQALTEIQIFAATAAIPDNSLAQPAARVAGTATTYTHSATVPNGSTLYFRLKACNAGGCSPFSNQASRPVNVSSPGVPTGVAVTVTVVVQAQ